jgi:hypothetical protein
MDLTDNFTQKQKIAFLVVAILGFVLAEASDGILRLFIPIGPDLARASAICRILGNIILTVGLTFAISMYIRHARFSGLTRNKIIFIVLCLLLPVIMIVLNYKTYSAYRDFYQYIDTTSAEIESGLVNKMNNELPGQKKSRMSYLHAQGVYRYEGRIIEYQSPEGDGVFYTPNVEDQKARQLITFGQAHNESNKTVMILSSVLYLLSFLGICYFGLIAKTKTREI